MTRDEIMAMEDERLSAHLRGTPFLCRKCGGTEYKVWGRAKPIRLCPVCRLAQQRKYIKDHRGTINSSARKRKPWLKPSVRRQQKDWRLQKEYGITMVGYEALAVAQKGLCAICGKHPKLLVVDHCHFSGEVRGLLCDDCNVALGRFKDNPHLLRVATAYLERDTK